MNIDQRLEKETKRLTNFATKYVPYLVMVMVASLQQINPSPFFTISFIVIIFYCLVQQIRIITSKKKLLLEVKKQWSDMRTSLHRFRSLFSNHPDAAFMLNDKGECIHANTVGVALLNQSQQTLIGNSFFLHLPASVIHHAKQSFEKTKQGKAQIIDVSYQKPDSSIVYLQITYIPIVEKETVTAVFCMAKDNTKNIENQKQVNYLAYHDSLTGLPNRRALEQLMEEAVTRSNLDGNKIGILFLDLDHFKVINDTLGHTFGDKLLQAVGERLVQSLSHQATVARHGGDEFIILIDDINDENSVIQQADLVLSSLNRPFIILNHHITVTPSIGISIYPDDAKTTTQLLKNADLAMYRVKYHGKNHYRMYTSLNAEKSFRKWTIEKDIYTAMKDKQLVLFYQAQIDKISGRIIGMEALVRWDHPELGIIPPGEFISIAEATGLICDINEWVLECACSQQKRWEQMGYDIRISVNISPQQFYHERDLIQVVKNLVSLKRIQPKRLIIEITETLAINNMNIAIDKLLQLKEFGIMIALDDFGTGYSSLSYLTSLPIDEIKIAKEFIHSLDNGVANQAVLSSVINLTNELGLSVVVEGIECIQQLEKLTNLKYHLLQGYLFSKPLPETEATQLLIDKYNIDLIDAT
ncbi:EAL domain-containing protein [Aquibacillus salsiterrae]|uniref:EAL domain-containing protein n=1 Tax=Aquibacillus salsiterrae TaxID=2950439 RepID=A0A9X3WGI9_9BACI|nr:EAL domain-containing protein [Aquibacillus salsiterrae]MDC3417975.1 EAL domain-containing protein [Aquibacillus salsiterrae]